MNRMKENWDAVVVGAGPAGMAFAADAAEMGLSVLALDEQDCPGGQIYRNMENQSRESLKLLGPDYGKGLELVERFRASRAQYIPGAVVWKLEADGRVSFTVDGECREIRGKRIVIAIGAMERPVPFSGWTQPGIMGVGAADTLLKTSGMVPQGPVAMAGNGPLMFSVADHLSRLGVEITHLLDSRPKHAVLAALPHLTGAVKRPGYLLKGAVMMAKARKAVGNWVPDVENLTALGEGQLNGVAFQSRGESRTIEATTLLVHQGIIPRWEFTRQLDLPHGWDPIQRYWYPQLDPHGRSGVETIYVAGDNGYVHGAEAARIKGQLAAVSVAADIGKISPSQKANQSTPLFNALKREIAPRAFVDAAFRPSPSLFHMADDTLVCRCEEVTAGKIRQAIAQGMTTPEMVKSVTRCGMGPCQGRMCGPALTELVSQGTGTPVESFSPISIRPPVRNLFIGDFTKLNFMDKEAN
ncbi:MAG: NAD(P)/FAD-dependent oxidoreductase [Desulfobacterales bacterium]|nr:NAD(P)/FAD-dependent oxidoreductase [Desulfobacterales bacterium]